MPPRQKVSNLVAYTHLPPFALPQHCHCFSPALTIIFLKVDILSLHSPRLVLWGNPPCVDNITNLVSVCAWTGLSQI